MNVSQPKDAFQFDSYVQSTNVNVQDFQEFDFVVVGGGTSGLTCAATLAKVNTNCTIGVLEAGEWRSKDPLIELPSMMARQIANPKYDWCLTSCPQKHCNNREMFLPRGKLVGGSSAINFLCWQRGYEQDFNDIASLGNPGWDWNSLNEDYHQLTKAGTKGLTETQKQNGTRIDLHLHGDKGPIELSHSVWYCEAHTAWTKMMRDKGLKDVEDGVAGGKINGIWNTLSTIDSQTYKRVHAGTAFYENNGYSKLENFKILTNARVIKIDFDRDSELNNAKLCAKGVRFLQGGKEHFVTAKREVILSAGTFLSPQLLELSGIGGEKILQEYNILPKHINENVGKNYQEHSYIGSVYEAKKGLLTLDQLRDPVFLEKAKVFYTNPKEDKTGGVYACSGITSFAFFPMSEILSSSDSEEFKKLIKQDQDRSDWNEGMRIGHEMQMRKLLDPNAPAMEIAFYPAFATQNGIPKEETPYITQNLHSQYPPSRGSVHIQSNNPTQQPKIDINLFSNKADLRLMALAFRNSIEFVENDEGMSNFIVDRHCPKKHTCKTIEEYENYIKQHVETTYHPVGTCSMMPKELGGVVDSELRVYGTENVRVVDASIIPIMPAGHIHVACYIIGHKAAKMISQTIGAQTST